MKECANCRHQKMAILFSSRRRPDNMAAAAAMLLLLVFSFLPMTETAEVDHYWKNEDVVPFVAWKMWRRKKEEPSHPPQCYFVKDVMLLIFV